MVDGIPPLNHPNLVCEACLLEKHARRSFPKGTTSRISNPLKLVHSDVCVSIYSPSFDKKTLLALY